MTVAHGIHPALAALELLLYPDSTIVILNKALAFAGMSLIAQPKVPVVLLVWGAAPDRARARDLGLGHRAGLRPRC